MVQRQAGEISDHEKTVEIVLLHLVSMPFDEIDCLTETYQMYIAS